MLPTSEEVSRLLQARDRELSALQAVALACSEEAEEDRLIERVTGIVCALLPNANFGIVLLDEVTGLLADHASARRGPSAANPPVALGEGVLGTVALTRRAMRLADVRREPVYRVGDPATRSELAVPMLVRGQLLGILNSESVELDAFSEADERLLTILAGQLAPALARLRAILASHGREERYRAIFEHSGRAMVFLEEDGTVSICNKKFERLSGWPREEVEGRTKWMAFVAGEADLLRISEIRQRRFSGDAGTPRSYEFEFLARSGARSLVVATSTLMPGKAQALVVLEDITERRRMEQAVAASEDRYRSLFNEVPVGLYQTTPDGRHLAGNRTYLEMIGVKDLAALEHWNVASGYARPEERALWCQEMEARGFIRREAEWHCPDGRVIWVDERARFCRDAQGTVHYDGSVLDITERKLAELAEGNLRDRLRQAEKLEAIGQLAGGVAHDFNNQLCAITAFAESLEELAAEETQKRFAQNILRSCQRSADLTRKLLAFARKGSLVSEPVDLHQIILEVVSLLKHTLDKRIVLRTRLAAERWVVEGDPTQLENALMNLAINARDAMPGGGLLAFETRIRTLDDAICRTMPYEINPGTYLEVALTDTGTGMEPETLQHIFEPFFTTKGLGQGTGLGLASVYGTVNQHHGYIQVYSTPGHGACFKLYLPLGGGTVPVVMPVARRVQPGTGHILFVDDEPFVVQGASTFLESLNYRVTVCEDGADCLEIFAREWRNVDLVILDMVMPGIGGQETFQALRRIHPEARVLLISGFNLEDEARQLLKAGARGYLQKPFRRYELAIAVARALKPEASPGTP